MGAQAHLTSALFHPPTLIAIATLSTRCADTAVIFVLGVIMGIG